MRFNREALTRGLRDGVPIKDLADRAVGKTTAAAFAAIAKSYARPGEWVLVEDPDDDTYCKRRHIIDRIHMTLALQRLDRFEVQERRYDVYPDLSFVPPQYIPYVRDTTFKGVFIRNTFAESA